MRKKHIGSLIEDLRKKQNISRKSLCEGLCESSILSKLELGESVPNILLVDRFLQRLGKSPDMFEVLLSDDEYKAMLERLDIEKDIECRNWECAERKLSLYLEKNFEPRSICKEEFCD